MSGTASYTADCYVPTAVTERLSENELCPPALLSGQEAAFERDIRRLQARMAEFVEVSCPACGGSQRRFEFTKHRFAYHTCQSCATLYMSPRPSPDVMAAYYADSENYQYWAEHIFPASEASRLEKVHRPWLQRVVQLCDLFEVPRGRLLEVGAGFGTFCCVAMASGAFEEVVAVEPTPELAESYRQRGVNVINKKIEDIRDEVPAADVAVAFEVIEHLFEPRVFLEQMARIVRPGGLIVLSCPNGQGFDISLLRELSLAIDPEHVNLFNPGSLRRLVESCGYDVLQVTTPGRLDTEFVHEAVRQGKLRVSNPFLQRVLVDEYDQLGWPFQQFLAENGLSSHMWLAARRV